MFVVGQTGDGVLLVATDGMDARFVAAVSEQGRCSMDEAEAARRTFIHSYEVATGKCEVLYTHNGLTTVVGASINNDRTLLGFSTLTRRDTGVATVGENGLESSITENEYESWLVEIHPQSNCYSLNVISREFQRVQFCPVDKVSSRTRTSFFVFILDNVFIHLYQIAMKKRDRAPGFKIFAQPMLQTQLFKHFLWYQWDVESGHLYVIVTRPKAPDAGHVLRGYAFNERRPDCFAEFPLPLLATRALDPPAAHAYLPLALLPHLPIADPLISLVTLPSGDKVDRKSVV